MCRRRYFGVSKLCFAIFCLSACIVVFMSHASFFLVNRRRISCVHAPHALGSAVLRIGWRPENSEVFKFEIWSYGISSKRFFLMLLYLSYLWIPWWGKFKFQAIHIRNLCKFECIKIKKEKFIFTNCLNFKVVESCLYLNYFSLVF